jgi:osmotically-inducible protein OsmY
MCAMRGAAKTDAANAALASSANSTRMCRDSSRSCLLPHFRPSAAVAIATLGLMMPLYASLSGCVVAAAGSGAVAGYSVLAEDLSPAQQLRDVAIKSQVEQAWGAFNQDLAYRLDATVFDGQVLITGRVPRRHWREVAVRRASRIAGVTQVYDEMAIGSDTHFIDSARDTWITTQLRGELIADINVKSVNFVIKTSDGVVYLLGFTRSPIELNLVINHARRVLGVRRVVSLVRPLGTAPMPPPPGAGPPPPAGDEPPPPAQPQGLIHAQPLN